MRTNLLIAAVAAGLAGGFAWYAYDRFHNWRLAETPAPATSTHPATRIVDMPTNGGQFEIATVTATETIERESSGKYRFPGGYTIDLGTTYSRIRFTAVYRYHLKMANVWQLELRPDRTCIVRTGPVEPTLPVAFDTATLERLTTSGWARFDKNANLAELEKGVTAELARASRNHVALAMETGRPVVERWVSDWLLKYERDGRSYRVIVVYPGEHPPPLGAGPRPARVSH